MTLEAVTDLSKFRGFIYDYQMPGFDPYLSPELMMERLISFRFPFSREGVGESYLADVRQSLLELPVFLLQAMTYYKFTVQLDTAHEIGAMMDIAKRSMYLHRFFMMDGQAFELRDNEVFPYGITETMLHELGHFIDYVLTRKQKLSHTPLFKQAIRHDVEKIPKEMILSHQERVSLCHDAGGYLKLPPIERKRVDLALFCLQTEETFAEAFLHLTSNGRSREVIPEFFPNTIDAVAFLTSYHLKRWQPSPL